ncbi:hypothetical protein PJI17_12070 [Mycobacterium kansasii]
MASVQARYGRTRRGTQTPLTHPMTPRGGFVARGGRWQLPSGHGRSSSPSLTYCVWPGVSGSACAIGVPVATTTPAANTPAINILRATTGIASSQLAT